MPADRSRKEGSVWQRREVAMKKSMVVMLTESAHRGCLRTKLTKPLRYARETAVGEENIKPGERDAVNREMDSTVNLILIIPLPDDGASIVGIAGVRPVLWH